MASAGAIPRLEAVLPYTFTDAALTAGGAVAFLACAEASPDTYRDGEVLGCRVGIIRGRDVRTANIRHPDGSPVVLKLEGIEARPGDAGCFDVVADPDRPDEPALRARLVVRGLAQAVDPQAT